MWAQNHYLEAKITGKRKFAEIKDFLQCQGRQMRTEGKTQAEVAKSLGVTRQAIDQWEEEVMRNASNEDTCITHNPIPRDDSLIRSTLNQFYQTLLGILERRRKMILIDTDKNLMAIITEPKVETDVSLAMAEHLAELEEFHSNAKIFTRKIEAYLADLTAQARYLATLPERLAERGHK